MKYTISEALTVISNLRPIQLGINLKEINDANTIGACKVKQSYVISSFGTVALMTADHMMLRLVSEIPFAAVIATRGERRDGIRGIIMIFTNGSK